MKRELATEDEVALLSILKKRFTKHMYRHMEVDWSEFMEKLQNLPEKLWSIHQMEITGGEPDVIGYDELSREFIVCDCSKETPKGRVSLCYDQAALESRKKHKPRDSAMNLAEKMGISMLTEKEYLELQSKEEFDNKTSSWIVTPPEVREKGGAIFGDRRFGRVFIYHNGADSYYGVRGFRATLRI